LDKKELLFNVFLEKPWKFQNYFVTLQRFLERLESLFFNYLV